MYSDTVPVRGAGDTVVNEETGQKDSAHQRPVGSFPFPSKLSSGAGPLEQVWPVGGEKWQDPVPGGRDLELVSLISLFKGD